MPKLPKGTGIMVKVSGEYVPQYQTEQAAGCDLRASLIDDVVIPPKSFCTVPTGIRIEIPPGYEAQVRPRSGLARNHGVGVLNAPGTIDADYRGEIEVILFNISDRPYTIKNGDRIAQLVFSRTARAAFKMTTHLNETERGTGGFGHTGVQ